MQWEGNYARNLSPALRDPEGTPSASLWAYIDVYDLADALRLAAERDTPGHEVVYIASPDNHVNRPLAELVRHHHGDEIELRELDREDASGISIRKARELLGYDPEPLLARLPDRRRRAAPRGGAAARARGDGGPARPGAHRLRRGCPRRRSRRLAGGCR